MSDELVVTVTAADLAAGIPKAPGWCALALAVKRATGAGDVFVGGPPVSISGRTWLMDAAAVDWLGRFDRGETAEPVQITLTREAAPKQTHT